MAKTIHSFILFFLFSCALTKELDVGVTWSVVVANHHGLRLNRAIECYTLICTLDENGDDPCGFTNNCPGCVEGTCGLPPPGQPQPPLEQQMTESGGDGFEGAESGGVGDGDGYGYGYGYGYGFEEAESGGT